MTQLCQRCKIELNKETGYKLKDANKYGNKYAQFCRNCNSLSKFLKTNKVLPKAKIKEKIRGYMERLELLQELL